MSSGQLMKDPYYAKIMFSIESLIHAHDQGSGGTLKDSDAKSSIRKALSMLKGKPPVSVPKNERERLKEALAIALAGNYQDYDEPADLPRSDYIKALLAVEDSLKTRREHHGHSRGYLDFLTDFIANARHQ